MRRVHSIVQFVLVATSFMAGCAGGGVTDAAAALVALGEVDASVNEALSNASFAFNSSINNTAVQLGALSARLREDINATSSDIDRRLTAQQERALNGILVIRDSLDATIGHAGAEVLSAEVVAAQVLSDLPFTNNEPRVVRTSVAPFVSGWTQSLAVSIEGYNLDAGENVLTVGTLRVNPILRTATKLQFAIPASAFDASIGEITDRVKIVRAGISLAFDPGIFRERKTVSVAIPIRIVPRNIGSAIIAYRAGLPRTRKDSLRSYSCSVGTRGTPASGSPRENSVSCLVNAPTLPQGCNGQPQTGLIVGQPSIVVEANRHGGGHRIESASSHSFSFSVTARSRRRPYGGGGSYRAHAIYMVEYPCKVRADTTSPPLPLIVGSEAGFALPADSDPEVLWVKMQLFDGSERIVTGPRGSTPFSVVEQNSQRVVVRPLSVERN